MANRQLAKGNLVSAEFILGRKLTDEERAIGTIDFLREREVVKAKLKQSKEIVPVFASQKKPNITGTLTDTVMQQHQQAQVVVQARNLAHAKARNAMQAHAQAQAVRQAAAALALAQAQAQAQAQASAAASVALPVTPPPTPPTAPPPSRPRRVPQPATGRQPGAAISQADIDFIQGIRSRRRPDTQRYAASTEAGHINTRLSQTTIGNPKIVNLSDDYDDQLKILQGIGYTGTGVGGGGTAKAFPLRPHQLGCGERFPPFDPKNLGRGI